MTQSKQMKLMSTTVVAMAFALAATGCANNNNNSQESESTPSTVAETILQPGEQYTVRAGDTLINDGDAKIKVTHLVSSDVKKVEILSGSAHLLSGNL